MQRTKKDPTNKVARGHMGNKLFEALIMVPQNKKVVGKDISISVIGQHLTKWLRSDDGASWRVQRDRLLTEDVLSDCDD